MWTLEERFYLVLGFIVAVLAAHGAIELTSAITEPPNSAPLAIGIAVFTVAIAFMIKATEALQSERARREIEEFMRRRNSN